MNFPAHCLSSFATACLCAGYKYVFRILFGASVLLLSPAALPGDPQMQTVLMTTRYITPPPEVGEEWAAPTMDDLGEAELRRIYTLLVLHTHVLSTSIDEAEVTRRRGMLVRAGNPTCGSVEPLGAVQHEACSRLEGRVTRQ